MTATMMEATSTEASAEVQSVEAEPAPLEAAPPPDRIFKGPKQNMVTGIALTAAGVMAFSMGLGATFFAGATAWVFLVWGLLLIYGDLLAMGETYRVTEEAFIVANPFRWWGPTRRWPWEHISRAEVKIQRSDPTMNDLVLYLYYTPPDQQGVLSREDVTYDPELATLVVEKAGLKPPKDSPFTDFRQLPQDAPGLYSWT